MLQKRTNTDRGKNWRKLQIPREIMLKNVWGCGKISKIMGCFHNGVLWEKTENHCAKLL